MSGALFLLELHFKKVPDKSFIFHEQGIYDFEYQCDSLSECSSINLSFLPGYYHCELWGASGGGMQGGDGGYTHGFLNISEILSLFLFLGGKGSGDFKGERNLGGYNGGGNGGLGYGDFSNGGAGGGATDLRTICGNWDDKSSLLSRVLIAGGGGGSINWLNEFVGGAGGGKAGNPAPPIRYSCDSQLWDYPGSLGGNQTDGFLRGKGQDAVDSISSSCGSQGNGGGGGGLFGGYSNQKTGKISNVGGGGGSGYVSALFANGETTVGGNKNSCGKARITALEIYASRPFSYKKAISKMPKRVNYLWGIFLMPFT